jgi:hypothetical protein
MKLYTSFILPSSLNYLTNFCEIAQQSMSDTLIVIDAPNRSGTVSVIGRPPPDDFIPDILRYSFIRSWPSILSDLQFMLVDFFTILRQSHNRFFHCDVHFV